MTVYRGNEHFWTQLQGQPPLEVFPETQREFFATAVDAQISFQVDAHGRASTFGLHQNGRVIDAPRMDDGKAKELLDAVKAKIQQNVPTPGSEQALRRNILELASGKPDYDCMSAELAAATRQ